MHRESMNFSVGERTVKPHFNKRGYYKVNKICLAVVTVQQTFVYN